MRRLSALFAVLIALGPAMAAEKPGDPGTNVEMPFLIAPMTVDGKLYGYAYISLKAVTASQPDALLLRGKLAFVQDAFVRDVNAAPIGKAGDPKAVDEAVLTARLLDDARRIVGAHKVVKILVVQSKVTPIRPSEIAAPDTPGQTE
jgi:hypothetical protein